MVSSFMARRLPASTPSLAGGVPAAPPAPPGAIFVLGPHGGYAVPPRRFSLLFGREEDDVHVPIGTHDPSVSRVHGRFVCDGVEWWLRNTGRRPIRTMDGSLLLASQEMPVEPGYLPLMIGQEHLIEVRVVGGAPGAGTSRQGRTTVLPDVYDLSHVERLVLTSLAQRYLRHERQPQPASWKLVMDDMNRLPYVRPDGKRWTEHTVANAVSRVRVRLSQGARPIEGIRAADIAPPAGNAFNHNLITALLDSATLLPCDLALLTDIDP